MPEPVTFNKECKDFILEVQAVDSTTPYVKTSAIAFHGTVPKHLWGTLALILFEQSESVSDIHTKTRQSFDNLNQAEKLWKDEHDPVLKGIRCMAMKGAERAFVKKVKDCLSLF